MYQMGVLKSLAPISSNITLLYAQNNIYLSQPEGFW